MAVCSAVVYAVSGILTPIIRMPLFCLRQSRSHKIVSPRFPSKIFQRRLRESNPCSSVENAVSPDSVQLPDLATESRFSPASPELGRGQAISPQNSGALTGIRTRVTRMRTWRPRPLDDKGIKRQNFVEKSGLGH